MTELAQRARDPAAPAQRLRERRHLAAAVAGQLDVVGEQRLEPGEIALLDGREEPGCQLVALFARRLEARPALLDVTPGAGGELAHVVLALTDDLGDLRVAVVEDVVKQQHRALLGREALEQHQHRQRERIGDLGLPRRIIDDVGDERLGQPLADVALTTGARGAQLVDRSRVVTVATYARGETICSPPPASDAAAAAPPGPRPRRRRRCRASGRRSRTRPAAARRAVARDRSHLAPETPTSEHRRYEPTTVSGCVSGASASQSLRRFLELLEFRQSPRWDSPRRRRAARMR